MGNDPVILLCGGKSSRMGTLKGLLEFGGKRWLEEQLTRFVDYGTRAIVVLGHDHEKYFEALPFLREAAGTVTRWNGLEILVQMNPKPEFGPYSSLVRGAEGLAHFEPSGLTGAFVLPIDVPAPGPEVWRQLQSEGENYRLHAVIPAIGAKKGHPVWLSREFLLSLTGTPLDSPEARLDLKIQALPPGKQKLLQVTDEQVILNLNTADAFNELKKRKGL